MRRLLTVITIDEIDKWNSIVKGFENYDVYYLAQFTKAFKAIGDGEPTLFYYEDNNIIAMNVAMKRDIESDFNFKGKIPPNAYFDLSTPYGYGGFLIQGNVTKESLMSLNEEYSFICRREGIISEFVRFHPVLNNAEDLNLIYDIMKLGNTITMPLTSQNEIWNNLSTNKKRWIKKEKQVGIEIYWGRDPWLFDKFKKMYYDTMEKNNARDYYYFDQKFFNSVLKDLLYHSIIFYAVYEEKIISMVLVLHCNGQIHHHLSASDQDYQYLASTNLIMYEIANWGCENGYKTFHLGGGVGSKEDNLSRFKSGFNKKSNTIFSIGKKIFNNKRYKELIEIRERERDFAESELFFPLYRI